METTRIFTVAAGGETDYILEEDKDGETVAKCIETGSVLKFPKGADLESLIADHFDVNRDLVPLKVASEE